jgi:hypothetical protein
MNYINIKRNPVIAFLLIFALGACQKDNSTGGSGNIVGKWSVTSSNVKITVNGTDIVQYLVDNLGLTQQQAETMANSYATEAMNGTIEFKSDGTYSTTSDQGTTTGTWDLSSDKKKLTLDAGTSDEVIIDVKSLTSSKLVLTETDTQTEDVNADNTPDTLVSTINITLGKA